MFSLLQPAFLFAAAGICVPILIHLWNVREGKTLKVGSIALVADQSSRAKRIRVSEWLLLLIRCLLIILAAVLLAGPVWRSPTVTSKGWLLVEPGKFPSAYTHYGKTIDSLLNAGYELRLFDTTFRAVTPADAPTTPAPDRPEKFPTLLNLLNARLPGGFPVRLLTSTGTGSFEGRHIPVRFDLTWNRFAATDTSSSAVAWRASADSIRIATTIATALGTAVTYKTVPKTALSSTSLTADTSVLRIGIVAGRNTADAGYLEASLTAIRQVVHRDIRVTRLSAQQPVSGLTWLFWLSDEPVPADLAQRLKAGSSFFQYAQGKSVSESSAMLVGEDRRAVPLSRRVIASRANPAVWMTVGGEPILTKEFDGPATVYRFYSRFNPGWNELPWSPAFPEALLDLLIPGPGPAVADLRTYPFAYQASLVTASGGNHTQQASIKLDQLFGFLLLSLFAFERWLSFKRSA